MKPICRARAPYLTFPKIRQSLSNSCPYSAKLRKSLLFRKARQTAIRRKTNGSLFELNTDLPSPCAVSYVHFAYSVRLPMQKKIPFGILFLHFHITVTSFTSLTPFGFQCKKKSLSGFCFCIWCAVRDSNPGPTD